MPTYALGHLNNAVLLRDLDDLVSQERGTVASVLAHLAEVDARRLYLPAGHPSMYEYCVRKLGWSEQAALKRVRAARAARRFPVIFEALAAGRLHLSAVVLLAPHLTADNAEELLAAAARRTRAEIEELLARWFPRSDVPARWEAIAPVAGPPALLASGTATSLDLQLSPGTLSPCGDTGSAATAPPVPGFMGSAQAPRLRPLAPERFALQFTIGKDTYEKLRYVQGLLSHQVPTGDVVQVFDRALDALKERLEKQKFAATTKPRPRSLPAPDARGRTLPSPRHRSSTNRSRSLRPPANVSSLRPPANSGSLPRPPANPRAPRPPANPRYIPAAVKRAVWARDGGQCTFVNAAGERCRARRMLEFDHIDPVARGGRATVDGVRLLCRGHNQYEADRRFGAGFMSEKRRRSRRGTGQLATGPLTEPLREESGRGPSRPSRDVTETRTGTAIAAVWAPLVAAPARLEPVPRDQIRDVMAGLRTLGFRAGEARRAVDFCERTLRDATLEERMRAALKFLCPIPG